LRFWAWAGLFIVGLVYEFTAPKIVCLANKSSLGAADDETRDGLLPEGIRSYRQSVP
jgi:hypothetical protein